MKNRKPFTQFHYNIYVYICCICYIYMYIYPSNTMKCLIKTINKMTNFKVQWENSIQANNPLDAANQAYNDISQAQTLGFTVIDEETQKEYSVDLSEEEGNETFQVEPQNTNTDSIRIKTAFNLLRAVLTQSLEANEFDEEIYCFLKENNQVPKDYIPYFED